MTAHSTPDAPGHAIQAALLDSRRRWRSFGLLATDIVFEVDEAGRLLFIAPDDVLGWHGASLLGRPASSLLGGLGLPGLVAPTRGLRTVLVAADGSTRCFELSVEPMADARGLPCGIRGVGVDITARERAGALAAAAMRRGEVLGHVLGQIRQEAQAPRMMEAALTALMRALGASGAAVLDLGDASVSCTVGAPVPEGARNVLQGDGAVLGMAGGQHVLACSSWTWTASST